MPVHVTDLELDDLVADGNKLQLRTSVEGTRTFNLSNGRRVTVTANAPQSQAANPGPYTWGLGVEAVTPTGPKTITIPALSGTFPLWDWRDRDQIAGESGAGTYTATLTVPADWVGNGKGITINVGKVERTAQIYLNDKLIGTKITSDTVRDASALLKTGANAVRIVVRTTLRNAVTHYNKTSTRTSSYGLRGPVTVTPYANVTVS